MPKWLQSIWESNARSKTTMDSTSHNFIAPNIKRENNAFIYKSTKTDQDTDISNKKCLGWWAWAQLITDLSPIWKNKAIILVIWTPIINHSLIWWGWNQVSTLIRLFSSTTVRIIKIIKLRKWLERRQTHSLLRI